MFLLKPKPDGIPMTVDYLLHWDTSEERISGLTGVFRIVSIDVDKLEDESPRATFEKNGEYWIKKTIS